MKLQFTKKSDGSVLLRCVRNDGAATWQRHDKQALFFSYHDLTHFAVETVLGFRKGFYGLLADGWEFADLDGKGQRGKLPSEGILVEHIVGLLHSERVGAGSPLSADEFNHQIALMAEDLNVTLRNITDAELTAVRKRIQELHAKWAGLAADQVLDLDFCLER